MAPTDSTLGEDAIKRDHALSSNCSFPFWSTAMQAEMTDTRFTPEPQSTRNLTRTDDIRHGNIELRHLHYFIAVAEELNFHRAADGLNISQPAVTKQAPCLPLRSVAVAHPSRNSSRRRRAA